MLLAQRIQIAIGRLLQFAVALAFFGKLELERLAVSPDLIKRTHLRRDLRA